jgi:hypothetical protein
MTDEFDTPQARLRRERSTVEALDVLTGQGVHIVARGQCGLVAHRGVLHRAEWLGLGPQTTRMVEAKLGFTVEEIRSCYKHGGIPSERRELRARIDARFLELAEAGGHMATLARVLGFSYSPTRQTYWTMERALKRARQLKEAA